MWRRVGVDLRTVLRSLVHIVIRKVPLAVRHVRVVRTYLICYNANRVIRKVIIVLLALLSRLHPLNVQRGVLEIFLV